MLFSSTLLRGALIHFLSAEKKEDMLQFDNQLLSPITDDPLTPRRGDLRGMGNEAVAGFSVVGRSAVVRFLAGDGQSEIHRHLVRALHSMSMLPVHLCPSRSRHCSISSVKSNRKRPRP